MDENKREKGYTIEHERGHCIVYDDEWNECGHYDNEKDAREDYPDAK